MKMKIAFIGIGKVGFALADNLEKKGHSIVIATDNPLSQSVSRALSSNGKFIALNVQEAVNEADLAFLAVPFRVVEEVLRGIDFNGKTLVDCTNPVGPGMKHGLNSLESGSERIQALAPSANVVKAFNIYGYENLANSSFPEYSVKPLMLIAGNSSESKQEVSALAGDLGFFPKDTGGLENSLHLEHMTLLWVKMVRINGHHPDFVWAYIER